ncbi:MAG TPA: thioredoxin family protein [Bacillota bacterium]|nr:thioredoxin family protein [Bacillota bacterium]
MEAAKTLQKATTIAELDAILQRQLSATVLVYANWCPYCMRFLPVFQKYAQGRNEFVLAEDNSEVIAEEYEVEIIPTVLRFERGRVVARLDGTPGVGLNENQLVDFLR